MLTKLIKSLHDAKAQVDELEAKVEKGLKETLATIHAEYGFDSVETFVKAVKKASQDAETRGRKAANRAFPRAKRAKINAAVRATVKNLVKAGKSGAEVARAVGISTASVQNIKKALGLVKTTRKAPQKTKAGKGAAAKATVAPKARKRRAAAKKVVPAAPVSAPAPAESSAAPSA
jgi:DNA invertase Pin-like site-specific DNA recombinase